MTREEIKERIKAKNNKIKRYQSIINQYQQNRTFKSNQRKFSLKVMNGLKISRGTLKTKRNKKK